MQFNNLFVLDMANNHQGSLQHGLKIIDMHHKSVLTAGVRAGIKFQFRDLPNFIHPEDRKSSTNKHVSRFLNTKLAWKDYQTLVDHVHDNNMLAICTPFDEASVDKIIELGFDILKIASCSAKDWPLLEKAVNSGLPIIASTGGLSFEEIDDLVYFFRSRNINFALMHCVSIYPTPAEACNLLNIKTMRKRYPGVYIGWSTHEPQDDLEQIGLALALGATMFERHIGVATNTITLNEYSSTPEQSLAWFQAYNRAKILLGSTTRDNILQEERNAIDSLKRGVYLKHNVNQHALKHEDVYFAFPFKGGITSGEFVEGTVTSGKKDQRVTETKHQDPTLGRIICSTRALLNRAGVVVHNDNYVEISHHFGMEKFYETGCLLFTIMNNEYAKKILVLHPGQSHPNHMHKIKKETFLVLWGELIVNMYGTSRVLYPGDQLTVNPNTWHSFSSPTGCVFEEISTTAFSGDSYYQNKYIQNLLLSDRKTAISINAFK